MEDVEQYIKHKMSNLQMMKARPPSTMTTTNNVPPRAATITINGSAVKKT